MGWIHKISKASETSPASTQKLAIRPKKPTGSSTTYIEDVEAQEQYRPASPSLPDEELPFIQSSHVRRSSKSDKLWIVVDSIVYDCTSFAAEHPGGPDVLEPFQGSDATWQFWRFHGRNEMEQYGKELRIGRTEGATNPFKEPPKYVGCGGIRSADEW